jgi:NAD(P)-dependent dehydrogenase (short-subunit alcohol dehydrogenase family)
MNLQLAGKLCVVTGSTGDGIGKNIAEVLVQQGANVVINGRSQGSVDKTIAAILDDNADNSNVDASKLFGVAGDVASADGAAKFVQDIAAIESKLGTEVYGLVNNVGIFHVQDFAEISDEKWHEYYQTNTMSGVRLSRHYLPKMLAKDEGRIVFISSECGVRPLPHMLAYGVSKTSQIALARGLAEMTKGSKVTVNSILPGPTMTGGVRSYMADFGKAHGIDELDDAVAAYFKQHETTSLLQRFLDPKEVANVTTFLLSPLASGVNGSAQHVDGGIVRHI